jgi:hypothetical protein
LRLINASRLVAAINYTLVAAINYTLVVAINYTLMVIQLGYSRSMMLPATVTDVDRTINFRFIYTFINVILSKGFPVRKNIPVFTLLTLACILQSTIHNMIFN